MTQSTYDELSALKIKLEMQIEAISILLAGHKRDKAEPKPVRVREPISNTKVAVKGKYRGKTKLWAKQDAIDFIINTIKVHNNVPMCLDELVEFAPFGEEHRAKVGQILATTLTSLYYGEVLTRHKKNNSKGQHCFHYNFP